MSSLDPLATGPQVPAEPEVAGPGTSVKLASGRPLRRYLLLYGIALAAVAAFLGGVATILLPNQVQLLAFGQFFTGGDAGVDLQQLTELKAQVDSGDAVATADQTRLLGLLSEFEAARASGLAIVTTVGAILASVSAPIIGVLSDRTRSRMGRRAPWILFGGILGAFLTMSLQFAPTVGILVVLYALAQTAVVAAAGGPVNASMADRVVESKRGTGSAVGGLGAFVGGIAGVVLVGATFASLQLQSYTILGAAILVGLVLFALLTRDRSSRDLEVPKQKWSDFLKGFIVPLRSSDYRWVWIAKLLLTFGYATTLVLNLYMLQSYIRPALSVEDATMTAPLLLVVGLPGTIIGLIVAGRLSDKFGRRKPFVIASSLLMAFGFIVPLISPTLPGLFVSTAIVGLAFGSFGSVDQALFIDVLPDKKAAGRDLGVASIAQSLGNVLAPVLAAQVVIITGGYAGIWIVATVLTVIAAVAIIPVKSVR